MDCHYVSERIMWSAHNIYSHYHFISGFTLPVKKIFNDKNNQEKVVQDSGLEYCIVRPGGLTVDPPTGIINVIEGEAGSITRADVASFCLDPLCSLL